MSNQEADKGCLVLRVECRCGCVLYLAASRKVPCLLALGASPAAAAAALVQKESACEEVGDEN